MIHAIDRCFISSCPSTSPVRFAGTGGIGSVEIFNNAQLDFIKKSFLESSIMSDAQENSSKAVPSTTVQDVSTICKLLKKCHRRSRVQWEDSELSPADMEAPFVWNLNPEDWVTLIRHRCFWSSLRNFICKHRFVTIGPLSLVQKNYNEITKKFEGRALYEVDDIQVFTGDSIWNMSDAHADLVRNLLHFTTFETTKTISTSPSVADALLTVVCRDQQVPLHYSCRPSNGHAASSTMTIRSSICRRANNEHEYLGFDCTRTQVAVCTLAPDLSTDVFKLPLRLTKVHITRPQPPNGNIDTWMNPVVLALSKSSHIQEIFLSLNLSSGQELDYLLLLLSNPSLKSLTFVVSPTSFSAICGQTAAIVDMTNRTGTIEELEIFYLDRGSRKSVERHCPGQISSAVRQNKTWRMLNQLATDGNIKLLSQTLHKCHLRTNPDLLFDLLSQHTGLFDGLHGTK
uniref:Uncharacterized protein n=1 Tax=Craspedostauros australis TaxID=1486917 RepID=A0A7R9WTX6_9STRA|mmetsp:Transcript_17669/g.49043  ORF Transcript_17669/g.49043 Transcript_17669/m.49043 type:complete len:457 (+) Transcript_17669:305-1675(+)|eukprot:CAMPEP_0198120596 /NCGR_PEP_ID=MMETSP1442-20131203/29595_1 /TAXON_ID= /ORGANISM="Craspedostauros australis, Strain CCMP3328" /LENGTH=456 /DNA_ID=CAMNT_0043779265 /DNA_START=284 /DNA_END=1654 /DNA_ORIENTATION=+